MKSTRNILLFSVLTIAQNCYAIAPDDQYIKKYQNNYEDNSFDELYNTPRSTQYYQDETENFITPRSATTRVPNRFKKPIIAQKEKEITVDSLTQESYITPEMLEALMFGVDDMKGLNINIANGSIENIPSVETLLENLPVDDTAKKTLHTMLEATEIALFVEDLSQKYAGLNFNPENGLKANLQQQKENIQSRLNAIGKQASYYSWIFGSSATDTNPVRTNADYKQIHVDQNSSTLTIPVEFIKAIANQNNYKQKPNSQDAAKILFQQCFIAQQHRFPSPIKLNVYKRKLTPIDYIYNSFPQFDLLCKDILKLEESQRRTRLLQIRQAVQTALFIANRKSAANIDYIIPKSAMPYLDGVIAELMRYDSHLNVLCKDPRFGATQGDITQLEAWSTMSKIAAGLVVAGAAVGVTYAYDKFNGTNHVGNAYNTTAQAAQTGYNATSQTLQNGYNQAAQKGSDVMQWLNKSNNTSELQPTKIEPITQESIKANQEKTKTNAAHLAKTKLEEAATTNQSSLQVPVAISELDAILAKPAHTRTGLEKWELLKQDGKNLFNKLTDNTDTLLNAVQANTGSTLKDLQAEPQQATPSVSAPKKSFWEQRIANANKGFDRGIDHAQLDADEAKFQAKATEIKIRNAADTLGAAKAAGLTYEKYEQDARSAAEDADKKYKALQQEAKKTKSALDKQKRLVENNTEKYKNLIQERERKERELKRAQAANPSWFFDTKQTAEAKANIAAITQQEEKAYKAIQSHKDEFSDLKRSSIKNEQIAQDAKKVAEQAQQAAQDAKFTRQVATIVEKNKKPLVNRLQEAKESTIDSIKSLPYDIQNFSLPTPESAAAKSAHERTGLDKAALIKQTIQKPFIDAQKQAEWDNSPAGQVEALAKEAGTELYNTATSAYNYLTRPATPKPIEKPSISDAINIPVAG